MGNALNQFPRHLPESPLPSLLGGPGTPRGNRKGARLLSSTAGCTRGAGFSFHQGKKPLCHQSFSISDRTYHIQYLAPHWWLVNSVCWQIWAPSRLIGYAGAKRLGWFWVPAVLYELEPEMDFPRALSTLESGTHKSLSVISARLVSIESFNCDKHWSWGRSC